MVALFISFSYQEGHGIRHYNHNYTNHVAISRTQSILNTELKCSVSFPYNCVNYPLIKRTNAINDLQKLSLTCH